MKRGIIFIVILLIVISLISIGGGGEATHSLNKIVVDVGGNLKSADSNNDNIIDVGDGTEEPTSVVIVDESKGYHTLAEISTKFGLGLDVDPRNGWPDECNFDSPDKLSFNLADSSTRVYHDFSQIVRGVSGREKQVLDSDGNGWPDKCDGFVGVRERGEEVCWVADYGSKRLAKINTDKSVTFYDARGRDPNDKKAPYHVSVNSKDDSVWFYGSSEIDNALVKYNSEGAYLRATNYGFRYNVETGQTHMRGAFGVSASPDGGCWQGSYDFTVVQRELYGGVEGDVDISYAKYGDLNFQPEVLIKNVYQVTADGPFISSPPTIIPIYLFPQVVSSNPSDDTVAVGYRTSLSVVRPDSDPASNGVESIREATIPLNGLSARHNYISTISINPVDTTYWIMFANSDGEGKIIKFKESEVAGNELEQDSVANGFMNMTKLSAIPTLNGGAWVVDPSDNEVVKLKSDATVEITKTEFNGKAFKNPSGVSSLPDGSCWITDDGNNRVVKIGPNGEEEFEIEGFNQPVDISCSFAASKANFYISSWSGIPTDQYIEHVVKHYPYIFYDFSNSEFKFNMYNINPDYSYTKVRSIVLDPSEFPAFNRSSSQDAVDAVQSHLFMNDLNEDGILDLIYYNNEAHFDFYNGADDFDSKLRQTLTPPTEAFTYDVFAVFSDEDFLVADFNNDGVKDFVVHEPFIGHYIIDGRDDSVMEQILVTDYARSYIIATSTNTVTMSTTDFNNDGVKDLVISVPSYFAAIWGPSQLRHDIHVYYGMIDESDWKVDTAKGKDTVYSIPTHFPNQEIIGDMRVHADDLDGDEIDELSISSIEWKYVKEGITPWYFDGNWHTSTYYFDSKLKIYDYDDGFMLSQEFIIEDNISIEKGNFDVLGVMHSHVGGCPYAATYTDIATYDIDNDGYKDLIYGFPEMNKTGDNGDLFPRRGSIVIYDFDEASGKYERVVTIYGEDGDQLFGKYVFALEEPE